MHGVGVYVWANGDRYTGEWRSGAMHGHGTYEYVSSGQTYTGNYQAGKKHGEGTMTFADGSVFTGAFKNGDMLEGTVVYASGDRSAYSTNA